MAKIRVLSKANITEIFNMKMALQAVEQAYLEKATGKGNVWPMVFHEFDPGHADLDIKSGDLTDEGIFGCKVVSWFGANPDRHLPALFGTSLIFDMKTGEPKALLNAGPITDLRTGAAGALGIKYLARKDSRNLLMVGCGELAPYLIAATLIVKPDLEKVVLVNPHHPEKAIARLYEIVSKVDFILEKSGEHRTAEISASVNIIEGVQTADIIITATPSHEALIEREWVKPGTHFSCMGSDMNGKQEIDVEILNDAIVFGDDQNQCISVGECEKAYNAGLICGIRGEIGEVISGKISGRAEDSDITVFDSTGIALQDLASAAIILEKAEILSIGTEIEL